jgi:hypothetical protein
MCKNKGTYRWIEEVNLIAALLATCFQADLLLGLSFYSEVTGEYSSETSVDFQQTTDIPEDRTHHNLSCGNFESYKI